MTTNVLAQWAIRDQFVQQVRSCEICVAQGECFMCPVCEACMHVKMFFFSIAVVGAEHHSRGTNGNNKTSLFIV